MPVIEKEVSRGVPSAAPLSFPPKNHISWSFTLTAPNPEVMSKQRGGEGVFVRALVSMRVLRVYLLEETASLLPFRQWTTPEFPC